MPGVERPDPIAALAAQSLAQGPRFGVEVEHQGLSSNAVGKIVAKQIPDARVNRDFITEPSGRKWRLDRDAGGVELVTPILQGTQDMELLQRIVAALKEAGGSADHRAGLHVHIDATNLTPEGAQVLIRLMGENEHWLYPIWGVHENRRTRWCQKLSQEIVERCTTAHNPTLAALAGHWDDDRYKGLNLQNYFRGLPDKNTVEYRYHNGSLNPNADDFSLHAA